jgi:glycosyltransferase involved in cell wall biosynthesis
MAYSKFSKIAILSHILPPSPSGQAMVLHRLLNGLPPDRYCLISREYYDDTKYSGSCSTKLAAKYYHLKPISVLPVINRFKLDNLSIAYNTLLVVLRRARQIRKIIQEEKCKLLIACTGDLYDLPAAYMASKKANIPFVPYLFDDYVYQWTGFSRSISKRLEPIFIKQAKDIIVPNEYMQKEYKERYGIICNVIHNPSPMPDLNDLDQAGSSFNKEETNIVYTGAIYHAHYDAFKNLITSIKSLGRDDVKLHIYTFQNEAELKHKGIAGSMVVYHSHIDQSEVPKVLRNADILFLPLAFKSPIPEVIKTSAPGKTGEYLSVGRPILVHAPRETFISWYFKEHFCGVVVDENDPILLAESISELRSNKALRNDLSRNARKVAEDEFSIDKMKAIFTNLINNL